MRRAARLLPIVALPLLEIFVISRVGAAIGAGPTFLLILAGVVIGALVIRYEGRRVLTRLRELGEKAQRAQREAAAGADPAGLLPGGKQLSRAAADAGIVMLGGFLFIFPGFVSDVLGLLCVLPFTRPLVRRLMGSVLAAQVTRRTRFGTVVQDVRMHRPDGKVVPGEVVDPPHRGPGDGGPRPPQLP